jgi:hypothetical protein
MGETAQQRLGRLVAAELMPAMLSMRPAGLARQIWFWIGFAAITAAILISTYVAPDRLGHERLRREGLHRLELYAAVPELGATCGQRNHPVASRAKGPQTARAPTRQSRPAVTGKPGR